MPVQLQRQDGTGQHCQALDLKAGRAVEAVVTAPGAKYLATELRLRPACGIQQADSPRGPGSLCPLCSFPTFEWHDDPATLPAGALAMVRADFPRWDPSEGACRQCLDSYVFRTRFAPSVAPRSSNLVQEGIHGH